MDEQADQNENAPSIGDENNELENNAKFLIQDEESTKNYRSPKMDAINEKDDVMLVLTEAEVASEQPKEKYENLEEPESVPAGDIHISQAQEELEYDPPSQTNISPTDIGDELENQFMRHLLSHQESVIFDSEVEVILTRQDLETSERGTTTPVQVKDKVKEQPASAVPSGEQDIDFEKHTQFLRQLHGEKGIFNCYCAELQVKLAEYFKKKSGESIQPQKWKLVSDSSREQHCTKYLAINLERARNLEITQQQAEEMELHIKERRKKVEKECQVFTALKHDIALTHLSQRLGKQAQVKVEQILATEKAQQNKIVQLLVENIKLQKILTLEAMFSAKAEWQNSDKMRTYNQDVSEKIAKRNEDLRKLRKKTAGTVAVLTHIKERFQWNQMQNQVKRAQLAGLEAIIARKRDLLSKLKQARNSLHVDNQKLKDRCGLLVNNVLLRDFEDKMDTFEELEEELRCLKHRQNQIIL